MAPEIPYQIVNVLDAHSGTAVPLEIGYYQIRAGNATKYLRFSPLPLHLRQSEIPDVRGHLLRFLTVPAGDWNVGYLARDGNDHSLMLKSVGREKLLSIPTWYEVFVDESELSSPRGWTMSEAQCYSLPGSSVYRGCLGKDRVVILEQHFPDRSCMGDTWLQSSGYSYIHGHDIAPKFLAHLTEDHERIIGLIVEYIPGGRFPTIEDLPACRAVLQRLHDLDLVLTHLNVSFFTVRRDGTAVINNLMCMAIVDHPDEFKENMDSLPAALMEAHPDLSGWEASS